MKLYRLKLTISCTGYPTETFYAPFITLFPTFKCASQKENDFRTQISLLYKINHSCDTESQLNIKSDYTILKFNPLSDIWGRFKFFLKYNY